MGKKEGKQRAKARGNQKLLLPLHKEQEVNVNNRFVLTPLTLKRLLSEVSPDFFSLQ